MSRSKNVSLARRDLRQLSEQSAVAVGVIQPLTTVPQIILLAQTQSAAGVSLLTWLLCAVTGLVFLWYGMVHGLRPVIVTQILWFILQMIVVVQVLIYG